MSKVRHREIEIKNEVYQKQLSMFLKRLQLIANEGHLIYDNHFRPSILHKDKNNNKRLLLDDMRDLCLSPNHVPNKKFHIV